MIFPVLYAVYCLCFRKKILTSQFFISLLITGCYIFIRLAVLRSILPVEHPTDTYWQRIPGFLDALSGYMKLLIFPFGLHMEYGNRLFSWTEPSVMTGAAIFFAMAYLIFFKNNNRVLTFCVAWFMAALIPVANIYPINASMAEHWLYLPSIGFFIALGEGLRVIYAVKNKKILALGLIAGLGFFYSVLTVRQNESWKEPTAFFVRTLKFAPDSPKIYYNLGNLYKNNGDYTKALECYKKAVAADAQYKRGYYNMGFVYAATGETEKAIESYKIVLEIDPDFVDAYNNLGNLYKKTGRREEALTCYQRAIERSPGDADLYHNLGNFYFENNEFQKALAAYLKAAQINPSHIGAYNNLGMAYQKMGRQDEALSAYEKVLAIDPKNFGACVNLGNLFLRTNNFKRAAGLYRQALEVNPDDAKIHYKLALAYYNGAQYGLAAEYGEKALVLGYPVPADFLEDLKKHKGSV